MGMTLDESKNDTPMMINDISVVVNESIKEYADNSQIDYMKNNYGEGLFIALDQAACGSCAGC